MQSRVGVSLVYRYLKIVKSLFVTIKVLMSKIDSLSFRCVSWPKRIKNTSYIIVKQSFIQLYVFSLFPSLPSFALSLSLSLSRRFLHSVSSFLYIYLISFSRSKTMPSSKVLIFLMKLPLNMNGPIRTGYILEIMRINCISV